MDQETCSNRSLHIGDGRRGRETGLRGHARRLLGQEPWLERQLVLNAYYFKLENLVNPESKQ